MESLSLVIGRIKANLKPLAAGELIWEACDFSQNAARVLKTEQNPHFDGPGFSASPVIHPRDLDKAPGSTRLHVRYPAAE
jgi:hypothetical protein